VSQTIVVSLLAKFFGDNLDRGGGLVHLKGEDSMATSWLGHLEKDVNSWKIPMCHLWERIMLPFPWVTHGKELRHLHLGLLMG